MGVTENTLNEVIKSFCREVTILYYSSDTACDQQLTEDKKEVKEKLDEENKSRIKASNYIMQS